MFELQVRTTAISQKSKNHQKKTETEHQVEGGAEFPPETPLPPRPHICWRFWERTEPKTTEREAKKRGRGRVEKKEIIFSFLKKIN
jgi:hypothetical protein